MILLLQLLALALGFILLGKGADWFVDGAAGIAARFGIPQLVIGLTIVAMGTSAPEAAVSLAAAFKGNADITIGNILGSNIMNIWIILGLAAVICPLAVARSTVRVEMPFVIGISCLLLFLGRDGMVRFSDGCVLAALFIVYLLYLYRMATKLQEVKEENDEYGYSLGKCVLWTVGGMGVIIAGSNITVTAATEIAKFLGLSERIIGLTIVALGTSLPELFTSVTAAYKGNADIAIGNIVGSNIFNILFVVGISSLVVDIPFAKAFSFDAYVTIAAAVSLWLCVLPGQRLARWGGAVMLIAYAGYLWHII
ncbi:MAG: calcium/sodium antiporter [Phascolarctobacterium sp.]|nr:calcium/sodium antiporter [Phascolarctobacterium sp.]